MAYIPLTANEREKRVSYYSQTTQEVANKLPMWHYGRRLRTSTYHKVLNALFGREAGEAEERIDDAFLGLLLEAADPNVPDTILKYQVPASVGMRENHTSRNLLLNGSFKLRTNPYMVADWWDYSGSVIPSTGIFNNDAIALQPSAGVSLVEQTQYLDLPAEKNLCASCYYKIPTWASAGSTVPTGHSLELTVRYKDGTTDVSYAKFSAHTSGSWERVYVALTPTARIDRIKFRVQTQNCVGFNISQDTVVDGCQLEFGTRPSQWEPSRNDSPHYTSYTASPPIDMEAEYVLHYVDTLDDFWYRAVPTRSGITSTRSSTMTASTLSGTGILTDYFGEDWGYSFTKSGNQIKKIGTTCDGEIYGSYDLGFFNHRGYYELGLSYRLLAITTFGDYIWAVLTSSGLPGSVTDPFLAIIEPRVPTPEPDYLEVLGAIQLPGIPTDITMMEFRYGDQQHVYMSNGTSEYRVRLYYDYYMFDDETYMSYFREEYDQLVLANESRTRLS